ncbi:MmgE/PrpD family protein [Petroclostridium sp. X23]|uniref:MmgE/PrpD family protein n=1 Tax=Petroclostridium sp. X23 TaxID=3045146 RepID=UPI0024ADFF95|nr:MmgE/PrpD family protein [Petroclostridium sp. X23]WHH61129.1 MmgE/PrpD family protein [Petroclostridium sp. X23]
MGQTRQLAEFVSSLQYEKLPKEVVASVKKCLLDYFGCTLFATQTDMGKIIIDYSKQGNSGHATILPDFEQAFNPANAALANGSCAHGFELDDVSAISISHPGACVIPAVLALAEERGISGKRTIEAIVAGYEVMVRVGSTIAGAHIAKGFHPTASFGTFGATAGCCKLLGLTADQTENAFGIAGSLASGLTQFSISGSMVKRIHAGKSAQQGVIVSQLAEKGFTGPAGIFEAELGFCRVFRDDSSKILWDRLTDGLGESYAIIDTTFKPSPTCGVLHTSVECIDRMKQNPIFDAAKIQKILVFGSKNLAHTHNVFTPDSILAAQYSLPFTLAMACLGDLADPTPYLSNDILSDQSVLELAKKVETEFDPEQETWYPQHFSAKVSVFFEDGTVLHEEIMDPKGSAISPFTYDELYNKYKKLSANIVSEAVATQLSERISKVEEFASMRDFSSKLV